MDLSVQNVEELGMIKSREKISVIWGLFPLVKALFMPLTNSDCQNSFSTTHTAIMFYLTLNIICAVVSSWYCIAFVADK